MKKSSINTWWLIWFPRRRGMKTNSWFKITRSVFDALALSLSRRTIIYLRQNYMNIHITPKCVKHMPFPFILLYLRERLHSCSSISFIILFYFFTYNSYAVVSCKEIPIILWFILFSWVIPDFFLGLVNGYLYVQDLCLWYYFHEISSFFISIVKTEGIFLHSCTMTQYLTL